MVNACYFTNVGEFIIKSLCLYWDFQYSWEYQSVYEFYGFGYAPDSVYRFQFLFVATYIEIPFMIMPIFNALEEMNPSLISASRDLGLAVRRRSAVSFSSLLNGVKVAFKLSLFLRSRSLC